MSFNKFSFEIGNSLKSDNEAGTTISTEMLNCLTKPKLLFKLILDEWLNWSANFLKMSRDSLSDFPKLSETDLYRIALGTYQLKQAKSYYAEHLNENKGGLRSKYANTLDPSPCILTALLATNNANPWAYQFSVSKPKKVSPLYIN
jgi:hypothetical protein